MNIWKGSTHDFFCFYFFLSDKWMSGKLARTSTSSEAPKVNELANSSMTPKFRMFGLKLTTVWRMVLKPLVTKNVIPLQKKCDFTGFFQRTLPYRHFLDALNIQRHQHPDVWRITAKTRVCIWSKGYVVVLNYVQRNYEFNSYGEDVDIYPYW